MEFSSLRSIANSNPIIRRPSHFDLTSRNDDVRSMYSYGEESYYVVPKKQVPVLPPKTGSNVIVSNIVSITTIEEETTGEVYV